MVKSYEGKGHFFWPLPRFTKLTFWAMTQKAT